MRAISFILYFTFFQPYLFPVAVVSFIIMFLIDTILINILTVYWFLQESVYQRLCKSYLDSDFLPCIGDGHAQEAHQTARRDHSSGRWANSNNFINPHEFIWSFFTVWKFQEKS